MTQTAQILSLTPKRRPSIMPAEQAQLLGLLDEYTNPDAIANILGPKAARIDRAHWEEALLQPLRDFLRRPSKSFRADLVRWAWSASGGKGEAPRELAMMVEILHAGSLIVDDIEDSALKRRGAPALHRTYGLPKALNCGNWLYFWAGLLIERLDLPAEPERRLHRLMGLTLYRCHGGQALDLSMCVSELRQAETARIVTASTGLKTGSLVAFAAAAAALAAGAGPEQTNGFACFGQELGIGLQMLDDLTAVMVDARAEKAKEDLVKGVPTWPWAWAASKLNGAEYGALQELARKVRNRQHHSSRLREELRTVVGLSGRFKVKQQLTKAVAAAMPVVEGPFHIESLRRQIERLEKAYG